MKPIYVITRYDEKGNVVWERLSRKKQSYYSTIGSINSFWGKTGDSVTLEVADVAGVTLLERFPMVEGDTNSIGMVPSDNRSS